ncbi:hypothetical protein M9Q43_13965 [Flavobacterium sp. HXWNR29]|uniref:hypothetical protein n=1 Tax=Flavobacterium odoriferum TaxID=2946604 RepID=UPI0021CB1F32|nr:hypothetical protein [Flavobacterium sp. HXWNR29]MCU4190266.1 hypothetical protein [Flavobacterium sp. HXWNR29]
MKSKILIIIILLSQNLFSQSLTEEYFNSMKSLWEIEITDEMKSKIDPKIDADYKRIYGVGFLESQAIIQKNNAENKITILKNILALKNLGTDNNEITILTETGFDEPNMKGFVIYADKFYFFQENVKKNYKVELYSDYIKDYSKIDENNSRSILFFILKDNRYDMIENLIEEEKKDEENNKLTPIVSYEIINYSPTKEKKLKLYYLNEYGTITE